MTSLLKKVQCSIVAVACAIAAPALAQEGPRQAAPVLAANAALDGFQEVPSSIFTDGVGSVRFYRNGANIDYELRYARLTGDVTVAAGVHVHLGRPGVNGGIMTFLCEGAGLAAPIGTPLCTDDGTGSGVVKGTIAADDILAIAGQGFPADDLDAFNEVLSRNAAYVNLHTDAFPGGEIRGAVISRRPSRRRR